MPKRTNRQPKPFRTTQAPMLAHVKTHPSPDPQFLGLRLVGDDGSFKIFGISAEHLSRLVTALIDASADLPPVREAEGAQAVPSAVAHHVEVGIGRQPNEAAIAIYVGALRLQFSVPASTLLSDLARLAQEQGSTRSERLN